MYVSFGAASDAGALHLEADLACECLSRVRTEDLAEASSQSGPLFKGLPMVEVVMQ